MSGSSSAAETEFSGDDQYASDKEETQTAEGPLYPVLVRAPADCASTPFPVFVLCSHDGFQCRQQLTHDAATGALCTTLSLPAGQHLLHFLQSETGEFIVSEDQPISIRDGTEYNCVDAGPEQQQEEEDEGAEDEEEIEELIETTPALDAPISSQSSSPALPPARRSHSRTPSHVDLTAELQWDASSHKILVTHDPRRHSLASLANAPRLSFSTSPARIMEDEGGRMLRARKSVSFSADVAAQLALPAEDEDADEDTDNTDSALSPSASDHDLQLNSPSSSSASELAPPKKRKRNRKRKAKKQTGEEDGADVTQTAAAAAAAMHRYVPRFVDHGGAAGTGGMAVARLQQLLQRREEEWKAAWVGHELRREQQVAEESRRAQAQWQQERSQWLQRVRQLKDDSEQQRRTALTLQDQLQLTHMRSELEGKREERERGLGGEIEKMLKDERSSWAAERAEAKRLQQQQADETEERKKEHAVHVAMLKREIAALRQQNSHSASTAAATSAGEGELQTLRAALSDAQAEAERRRKEDDERLASDIERDAERDEDDKRRKEREAAAQQQLQQLSDELIAAKRELNSRSDSTEQLQSALALLTAQKERMQEELSSLRLSSSSAAASFSSTVWRLAQQVRMVKEDSLAVRKACGELLLGLSDELVETRGFLLSSLSTQSALLASTMTKYKRELSLRRRLFNEVQELRGNIRVYCRTRPLLQADRDRGSQEVVSFDSEDADNGGLSISSAKGQQQHFDFDRVFTQRSGQQDVFDATRSLVTSVMDGYAVCIFAYGQTSSGKTHTMTGADSDRGINYRALNELFRIRDERRDEVQYDITVSMKEIYRETVRDLLATAGEEKELKLRTGPTGVFVEGLTEWPVHCEADVLRAMELGSSNRATGSTSMNEQSSRSHSLLSVSVCGRHRVAGISYFGSLHLIDLAGSERLSRTNATGERLKEAQAINKSLSSLANVLESLQRRERHIPYRDSKLTFLLQNSLGGHAKTLMIVNISPADADAEETLCSLNFASRVKQVELGSGARTVTKTRPADDAADGGREAAAEMAASKKVEEEKEAEGATAAARQPKALTVKAVPAASSSPRSDKKAAAGGAVTRSAPQPAVQKAAVVKRAAK